MSDKLTASWTQVVTIAGLIFTAGGGWYALSVQGNELEQVQEATRQDHDNLLGSMKDISDIKDDVSDLKSDVKAVKESQIEQRVLLLNVLAEIKKNGTP